jgi:serine/threonine-protein kinase
METHVGPYHLLRQLGGGGMASTWLAERTSAEGITQRVCLKRMRVDARTDPTWESLFKSEARTIAMLHHANIVSLKEFGAEQGGWWMALDLVEGQDLAAILRARNEAGERLPIEVVVYVAAEVAKALAYAHGRPMPVIHRDVSPSNTLVGLDGTVRITDFGLAKVAHNPRTRTGQMKGKTPYMAPEQLHGDPVDARTDVFGLGVTMFELLCGQRPFDGKTDLATQLNIAQGVRITMGSLRSDVPPALVALVDRMIENRIERRVPSADAVLDALSAFHVPVNVGRSLGRLATLT